MKNIQSLLENLQVQIDAQKETIAYHKGMLNGLVSTMNLIKYQEHEDAEPVPDTDGRPITDIESVKEAPLAESYADSYKEPVKKKRTKKPAVKKYTRPNAGIKKHMTALLNAFNNEEILLSEVINAMKREFPEADVNLISNTFNRIARDNEKSIDIFSSGEDLSIHIIGEVYPGKY